MATCNANTLLASGRLFQQLGGGLSQVARLALLKRILLAVNPAADTSTNTLLGSGKCFTCLTPGQQRIVKMQLLCEILAELGSTPPVPFVPTDIPGMVLWLDASTLGLNQGDDVSIFPDMSGQGNNFVALTDIATFDTTFFSSSVLFQGVWFTCNNALAAQPLSLFFVLRMNDPAGNDRALLGSDESLFYHSSGSPSPESFGLFTNGADAWTDGSGGAVVDTNVSIGMTVETLDIPQFFRNGVLQTNNLNNNNGNGFADGICALPGYPASAPTITGDCYIAEVVMYEGVISQAQIIQLQNYWATKWGI